MTPDSPVTARHLPACKSCVTYAHECCGKPHPKENLVRLSKKKKKREERRGRKEGRPVKHFPPTSHRVTALAPLIWLLGFTFSCLIHENVSQGVQKGVDCFPSPGDSRHRGEPGHPPQPCSWGGEKGCRRGGSACAPGPLQHCLARRPCSLLQWDSVPLRKTERDAIFPGLI